MSDTVDVNIRLDDHSADYSSGVVTDPLARTAYIIVTDKPIRLEMQSRDPGVLRDLGYALIDLADDLEMAQRPYVGDEDADTPAIALMKRGIAEMRDEVAREGTDEPGEAS